MGAATTIMQTAIDLATAYAGGVDTAALKAEQKANEYIYLNTNPSGVSPPAWRTLTPPQLSDDWAHQQIYNDFDKVHQQLASEAAQALADFIDMYYALPDITSAIDAITSAESEYWANDRNRIMAESLRQQNAALAQSAGRGFPMPTGALNATLQEIRVTEMNKLAEVSHQAAIKHLDVTIEMTKIRVDALLRERQIAFETGVRYVTAMMMPAEIAAKFVIPLGNYKAQYLSSLASYYNALNSADELRLRASTAQAEINLGYKKVEAEWQIASRAERVKAADASAQVYAETAKGALSALNSVGSIAATE